MAGKSLLQRAVEEHGYEGLVAKLGAARVMQLGRTWEAIARPEQLPPPGDWDIWLVLAGRGFGKTRTGAQFASAETQRVGRFALIAPTAADTRDVMVEGESGILSLPENQNNPRPKYEPSKRRITFPNGAIASTYSAEEPERLRGPQHGGFWGDELAAWPDPQEVWVQLQFGLRLGTKPRGVVTTTPRPLKLLRALVVSPNVAVTRGRTYDNAANLAPSFLDAITKQFAGTRIGRQEIDAEILDDNPGALWHQKQIDDARVNVAPALKRVAGALDPAVSSREDSDETGIIFGGVGECRCKGRAEDHAFVLEDLSGIYSPDEWARNAAEAYHRHRADRLIAEVNNGGEMVEATIRTLGDPRIAYRAVHASRGKQIRAEPVAALYEQGKVHHVGIYRKLEDQLTQWNPLIDQWSPDRLDALVWLLTDLMLQPKGTDWSNVSVRVGGSSREGTKAR